MRGVIIGTGAWEGLAKESAAAASEMTGLEFTVVTRPFKEVAHPSWLKLWIPAVFPDAEGWLILDADMVMLRKWDPRELLRPGISAVNDRIHLPIVEKECRELGLEVDRYVNGGFLLFDAAGAEMLKAQQHRHPSYGRWLEQASINEAFQKAPAGMSTILPQHYNHVCNCFQVEARPSDYASSTIVHIVGLKGRLQRFRNCRELLLKTRTKS